MLKEKNKKDKRKIVSCNFIILIFKLYHLLQSLGGGEKKKKSSLALPPKIERYFF